MKAYNRSDSQMGRYRAAMEYGCAFPDCGGRAQDVHHIVPLSQGGNDEPENYIALCRRHHQRSRLHRDAVERELELATFKHLAELDLYGFCIATKDDLREALKQLEVVG